MATAFPVFAVAVIMTATLQQHFCAAGPFSGSVRLPSQEVQQNGVAKLNGNINVEQRKIIIQNQYTTKTSNYI